MPRTKQRTPELRQHVLEQAVQLLASDGAAALTARSVAQRAGTSTAALYELLGGKQGLVREMFFEGFRRLASAYEAVPPSDDDPIGDLHRLMCVYRTFARDHAPLVEVMFGQPFHDFAPTGRDLARVQGCYVAVMRAVTRAIDAGLIAGDPTDVAIVLMGTVQGLVAAEASGRLGTSVQDRDRRFEFGFAAMVAGLSLPLQSIQAAWPGRESKVLRTARGGRGKERAANRIRRKP